MSEAKIKFSELKISFGDDNEPFCLSFLIRPTPLAQRWAGHLAEALAEGREFDPRGFVSFFPRAEDEISYTEKQLLELIASLQSMHPELDFGKVDFSRDRQAELNRLHVNFAHRHLDDPDTLPANTDFQLWHKFNALIHYLESLDRRPAIEARGGVRNAYINLTFDSPKKSDLTAADCRSGVLYRVFGTCYLGYSQVGRHITEIFYSRDKDIPLHHIQPFSKMSADMRIWLGHTQGHVGAKQLEAEMRDWYVEGEGRRVLEKIGGKWDPGALGIYEIPVASLRHPMYSIEEIEELQNRVHRSRGIEAVAIS